MTQSKDNHNDTDGDLLGGMATALSIDCWEPTKESKCEYEDDPSLAVNFICMHPEIDNNDGTTKATSKPSAAPPPPDKAKSARFQEIFVDLIGMICAVKEAGSRHLLDDRFDSFLKEGERAFKDSLLEFLQNQTEESKSTHAYAYLERILHTRMGYKDVNPATMRKSYQRPVTSASNALADTTTQEEGNGTADYAAKDTNSILNPAKSPGHVYVCMASVCDIQCDAFLCPSNVSMKKNNLAGRIFAQWRRKQIRVQSALGKIIEKQAKLTLVSHSGYDRLATFEDWPYNEPNLPLLIAGEVSLAQSFAHSERKRSKAKQLPPKEDHIAALLDTVDQFLGLSSELVVQHAPYVYRERHLLAVPVLGTGGGFAGDLTGYIVDLLLQRLNEYVVQRSNFDVVLVCADEATYAHAQVIRHAYFCRNDSIYSGLAKPSDRNVAGHKQFPCFHTLSNHQRRTARRLADLASNRHLSLFVGAGVSIGSGLPSWFGLLLAMEDCFTSTGDPSERTLGNDTNWDPLDMAAQLEVMCATRSDRNGIQLSLKQRVCLHLEKGGRHPGLLLSLLISLPCHSIVTQNYDQLIEQACQYWNVAANYENEQEVYATTKRNLSVMPYNPRRNAEYWLLKMHGCVSAPEEIVLTQKDYDNYEASSRSQVLSGLVQASLVTKHLLFVGFSLTDPNYLRIVDQVRAALRPYNHTQQQM